MALAKWSLTFQVFKKRSRMKINDYKGLWALGEEGILKVGSVKSIKETIWECSGAFSYLTSMTKPLNTSCSVPCFSEIRFFLISQEGRKKKLFSLLFLRITVGNFKNLQRLLKFSKCLLSYRNIMEKQTALISPCKHPKFLWHVIWGKQKTIWSEKINSRT